MAKKEQMISKERRLSRARKQRRNAIIEIASRSFTTNGYDHTIVDEIALEAGYTKMTIYNYFRSKDDLFAAVVSRAYQKLYEIMDEYLKQADVTYELRSMGNAYLSFVERYPDEAILFESGRLSLITSRITEKEKTGEQMTESEEEFRQKMRLLEQLMTSVITETMKNSRVEDKVDPFSVIMVLSTFAQAIRELIQRGKMSDGPEEKTREYLSVFFNIIDKGLKHYDD